MSWTILYTTLLFVAAAVMVGVAMVAHGRAEARGLRSFPFLAALIAIWIVLRALFLMSQTSATAIFWDRLSYTVDPLIPALFVAFVLQYTGRAAWLTQGRWLALFAIPFLTVILSQTTALHGLFTTATDFAVSGGLMLTTVWRPGPWFWVHVVYSYTLVVVGLVITINQIFHSRGLSRRQTVVLFIGVLLIVAGSLADIAWSDQTWLEMMPVGYAGFAMLSAFALFHYHFLDIMPVARGAVLEHMRDAVIVLDERDRIVDLNPAASRALGRAAMAATGQPVSALLPLPLDSATVFDTSDSVRGEIELPGAAGRATFEVYVSPLYAAPDHRIGSLLVLHNCTARKHSEAERERLIAELDAFAHSVAHDLKNPVTLVMGYADLLRQSLDQAEADAEQRDFAMAILTASLSMNEIIDSLLLLAEVGRTHEVKFEPLDMSDVVAQACRRLQALTTSTPVDLVVAQAWPQALGYPAWVESVWANLISNAIKYGGQHPHIELGADASADGLVRFWVQDAGPGLSVEERARLFKPGARLKSAKAPGHGLGLSIVRRIVDQLGGEVGVDGNPGHGSRFWFSLPAADGTAKAPPPR